jgi:uncharacterized protein
MLGLPWLAIFLAVPATYWRALRWLGVALLVLGYGAAYAHGWLGAPALAAIAVLVALACAVRPPRPAGLRVAAHMLFVVLAVALIMHAVPGFRNPRVIDGVRFTPDALPFRMYLNLDKPLTAFWLLLMFRWVRAARGPVLALAVGIAGWLLCAAACIGAAWALHLIVWEPKWPPQAWLFLVDNLLLVSVVEEVFFRGYLQGGIARLLDGRPGAHLIALVAADLVFALMHLPGGLPWVVFGGIAGIGYGLAYRYGGLSAAVLAHFGLNATHFLLFTYPMLQGARL